MSEDTKTNTRDKPLDAPFKRADSVELAPSDDTRAPTSPSRTEVKVKLSSILLGHVVISTVIRNTAIAVAFKRASDALRGARTMSTTDTKTRSR
jgi:hypothetical protein